MKLILGTAQLGMDYGVTNRNGRPSSSVTRTIIQLAEKTGVSYFDTAVSYGGSEKMIGNFSNSANIITKLPRLPDHQINVEDFVRDTVTNSLKNLRRKSLYGLLLHDIDKKSKKRLHQILKIFEKLKEEKLVENIGLSIYQPSDLDFFFNEVNIDLVQAPLSIFDQRLEHSGWLGKLKKSGITVHVRSIFLQGLLLQSPTELLVELPKFTRNWHLLNNYMEASKMSALELCLGYPESLSGVDGIVVGVNELNELSQILKIYDSLSFDNIDVSALSCEDTDLIDPRKWKVN
jgi:aryl-alcohol dehydrogenase-like predicted oxidoreductase